MMESPPSEKKSWSVPGRAIFSTRSQMAASFLSVAVSGGRPSPSTIKSPASKAGRALRSILPDGVRGISSRRTNAAGTRWAGSRSARNSRSAEDGVPAGPAAAVHQADQADRPGAPHRSHRAARDRRVPQQRRFDLGRLHPEPPHLDLFVAAPQELQLAPREPAGQVPRPVEAPAAEGVGDKALLVKARPVEVTAGQAGPAQVELARHARRAGAHLFVEDVSLDVVHGRADVADRVTFAPDVHAGADRGLGGAVGVDEPPAGRPPPHGVLVAHVTRHHQRLQRRQAPVRHHRQ